MISTGHLLRALAENPYMTQRQAAKRLGVSLGKCNGMIRHAEEEGLFFHEGDFISLTPAGWALLESYRIDNAVILAATVDLHFLPIAHKAPKALMRIGAERIIERHIRHLHERGITDITVVVGYLAEKFEYLADRFGVRLMYNREYAAANHATSLYYARHLLKNTYIIDSTQWMDENIYQKYEPIPWLCTHWHEGQLRGWGAQINAGRRILSLRPGGRDRLALQGPACVTRPFSEQLKALLEQRRDQGLAAQQWETSLMEHVDHIAIYANVQPASMVQTFLSPEAFRRFETDYNEKTDQRNRRTIAETLDVPEQEIKKLICQEAGVAGNHFTFELGGQRHTCRIESGKGEALKNPRQEAAVYKAIAPLDIAEEMVYMDPARGVKIFKAPTAGRAALPEREEDVKLCMQLLYRLHHAGVKVRHTADIEKKLMQHQAVCHKAGCIRFEDYDQTFGGLAQALEYIRTCGAKKVLCHMNTDPRNFLIGQEGRVQLLDWEHGGMCHGVADVAAFAVLGGYAPEGMDNLLIWYFDRLPSREERLLAYSYAAVAGLLWSLWGQYRQHWGDGFGGYALNCYRASKAYVRAIDRLPQEAGPAPPYLPGAEAK